MCRLRIARLSGLHQYFYTFRYGNRVKAVSKRLNITENKAKDLIQKMDKQRASYYNYYSSKRWGDSTSYHLTLDAGKLGIDGCVDMILKFREIMDAQK